MNKKLTPVMQQYMDLKEQAQDCVLFFRLGDFYEMFYEDAILVSRELNITLTSRNKNSDNPVPMAGVPYHSAPGYINKLIDKGYKVSIAEQISLPDSKDIVKRDIVKTITPGTVIDENALSNNKNNYVCSVFKADYIYFCYYDITTSEFSFLKVEYSDFYSEMFKISPSELLIIPGNLDKKDEDILKRSFYVSCIENDERFKEIQERHSDLFKNNLNIYDVQCRNMLIDYIEKTQKIDLNNVGKIIEHKKEEYVFVDLSAQKNLELVESLNRDNSKSTLFNVMNFTRTSMGARKLKKTILNPLKKVSSIKKRQDYVEELFLSSVLRRELRDSLNQIKDIERIINRIKIAGNNPADLNGLKDSIKGIMCLKSDSQQFNRLKEIIDNIPKLDEIYEYIKSAINEDAPVKISDGGFIKKGFDDELDKLKEIASDSKSWLLELEETEKNRTGIKNLKVKYNKVFGYFIEVSKSNIDKVPENYIRKQTMTNAERFFTPELKEKESFILGSADRMLSLEQKIFKEVVANILTSFDLIVDSADKIAEIDCYYSLAELAFKNNYIRPDVNDSNKIEIFDGRHPVVETVLDGDFIPNDCILDKDEGFFFIITGPNMAGKSTYIRQVALLVLMAQIGSFIPASSGSIGVVNKIYTRIGASDNLAMGLSTFMVEMIETADILKGADENSLVILDEIGRGTSTYDGLSIAWAITEYLANTGSYTMFATHYHELTAIQEYKKGIKNYNVAIVEEEDGLVFLHKIISGSADRSYGIHVAKLAGVPETVLLRSQELLNTFENGTEDSSEENEISEFKTLKLVNKNDINQQLNLFAKSDENQEKYFQYGEALALIEELKKIDINNTTPLKALNRLNTLKNKARKI